MIAALALFLASAVPLPEAFTPLAPIVLKVGATQQLKIAGITRSEIADTAVAESCLEENGVHVTARHSGATTMQVWTTHGTFTYPVWIDAY